MSVLPSNFKAHKAMSTIVAAADTAVAAIIKYIGVAVDDAQVVFGTHDLTFYTNYTTDAVKDTTIGTSGVILSDAGAADMTFAAVAALVNASANWRMLLVGARPEENFYTHSGTVQRVLASAADSANSIACRTEEGMKLYFDSSASLNTVAVIGPEALAASFAKFMNRVSRPSLFDGGFDISDYRTTAGVDVPGAAEKSAVQWTAV
ncbi:hypothetical protein HQ520_00375, partial [bacterium]|nr:hypothetical protein [bacterium]